MALMCFSTFASYGSNAGSYGFVSYTPLTADGTTLDRLSMPIVVDASFPTYGQYVNGTNRRFQTFNTVGSFAKLRFILPNAGGEYYVSDAQSVDMELNIQYSSSYLASFLSSSDTGRLFIFPEILDNHGDDFGLYAGELHIDVYVITKHDTYITGSYDFGLSSQMNIFIDDLPCLDDLSDSEYIAFQIRWAIAHDPYCRASDLSITLPLEYTLPSFDINSFEAHREGYVEGHDNGYNQGKNEWYEKYTKAMEGLQNNNAVESFFDGILGSIQNTLNVFFNLDLFNSGFTLGSLVALLLGALLVFFVLKLII